MAAWLLNGSKYGKTKKHVYPNFGFSIFFVEVPLLYLQQGGRKTAFVEVAWAPDGFGYRKTKKHVPNIFGLSIFFVEEPPLYLLQGRRKSALIIIYIYTSIKKRSRLRERQTASSIVKCWNTCPIFFDYLSFFVTDILLYLLQGGHKTAFVENIYTHSRLRERQTAPNIEKRWNRCPIFLNYLSFL